MVAQGGVASGKTEMETAGTVVWIGAALRSSGRDVVVSTTQGGECVEVIFELDGEADLFRSILVPAESVPLGTQVGSRCRLQQDGATRRIVLCGGYAVVPTGDDYDGRSTGREEHS